MRRSLVLILSVSLAAAAACTDGNGDRGAATPATTSPTGEPSAEPTGEPSPEPTEEPSRATTEEPPAGVELEDGRHFGFIESVDADGMTLVLDLAYFLTGEEANEAAADRGLEVPVPNDYYVVNDNPRLRTLPLSPDLRIRLIDWNRCCDLTLDGDLGSFGTAIAEEELLAVGDALYNGAWSPYWLEIREGRVVLIEEQYLP